MMETTNNKGKKQGFKGNQGFYVVLVLCLLAVGAAVTLLVLAPSADDVPPPTVQSSQSGDQTLSELLTAKTAAPTQISTPIPAWTPLPTPAPTFTAQPLPSPSAKAASASTKAAPPLSGGISWGYAVDRLIYSKTLDAWVTHEAVDIAADRGADVKSVFAGTVEKVYEDDYLGHTVVVQHTNDRSTLYANLDKSISVKAGDKINAGDVLGKVGNSAMSEVADGPHLHFAMYVDGKPVNPASYVRLG